MVTDERLAETLDAKALSAARKRVERMMHDKGIYGRGRLTIHGIGGMPQLTAKEVATEVVVAYLQSLRAQSGVRVKPLEWEQIGDNHWRADTAFGPWEVCAQPMFGESWRTFSPTGWKTYRGDDPEELKRLSEQELSKRILSSLEASPAPVSEEMVEQACAAYQAAYPDGTSKAGQQGMRAALTAALAAKGGQ